MPARNTKIEHVSRRADLLRSLDKNVPVVCQAIASPQIKAPRWRGHCLTDYMDYRPIVNGSIVYFSTKCSTLRAPPAWAAVRPLVPIVFPPRQQQKVDGCPLFRIER